MTVRSEAVTPGADTSLSGRPRIVTRRRSLPGGRAVLGGLLVALAMLGVAVTSRAGTDRAGQDIVVAARPLPPGHRLEPADLARRRADLPASTRSRAFDDVGDLVGSVTVGPLGQGELVQAGSVVEGGRVPAAELSFAVGRDRAVDGNLRPGDRVDVLVTYGSGGAGWSEWVVRAALVVAVDDAGAGALGDAGEVIVTLALVDADDVLHTAHAVRAGDVTVVRTTAAVAGPATVDDDEPYQPAGPEQGGASSSTTTAPGR